MEKDPFDIGAQASADALKHIQMLASSAVEKKAMIESMETALAEAKEALSDLERHKLPDAMEAVGMKDFTLTDGSVIKIKEYVSGSLPKTEDEREDALEWLEDDPDGVAIIKNTLTITFNKGDHNKAMALANELRERGIVVETDTSVHPATLQSFARTLLADGRAIPLEKLGLHAGRMAKIELPKEKKPSKPRAEK